MLLLEIANFVILFFMPSVFNIFSYIYTYMYSFQTYSQCVIDVQSFLFSIFNTAVNIIYIWNLVILGRPVGAKYSCFLCIFTNIYMFTHFNEQCWDNFTYLSVKTYLYISSLIVYFSFIF